MDDLWLHQFSLPLGLEPEKVMEVRKLVLRAVAGMDRSGQSVETVLAGIVAALRFIVNANEDERAFLEHFIRQVVDGNFGNDDGISKISPN